MLPFPDTLEQLALALPRIGGALDPYAFTLALVYEREIYPYVVAALAPTVRDQPARAATLLNYANGLTADGRRSLIVRTLAELHEDCYGQLMRFGFGPEHRHYWTTEPVTGDQRSMVMRAWDARNESPVLTAIRAAIGQMAERHATPDEAARLRSPRYVAEHVVLTRDCDLGREGELAIVSELNGSTMVLYFPDRSGEPAARKATTGTDYAYLRHTEAR